jgi:hypothetical protein
MTTRLKPLAVAALAAATIGIGGLAAAQPADAATKRFYTCEEAQLIAGYYGPWPTWNGRTATTTPPTSGGAGRKGSWTRSASG